MSWVLIDDNVPNHPKFLKAGPAASWLWLCGVAYCRKHHTNGHIPRLAIATLGVAGPRPLIQRLVEVRLWEQTESGWLVHDYQLQYGDDVQAKAEREAKHQKKVNAGRKGGLVSGAIRQATREAESPLLLQPNQQHHDEAHPNPNLSEPVTAEERSDVDGGSKTHPIRDLLRLHETLFIAKTGQKPAKYTGREAKLAQGILERYSFEAAGDLLRQFMGSKDPFIERAGFGFNIFESQINKLISERARPLQADNDSPAAATRMSQLLGRPS